MLKPSIVLSLSLSLSFALSPLWARSSPQGKTIVNNQTAAKQLLGKHKLNLQWIGWDKWSEFGNLTVTNRQGIYRINGRQTKGEDYLAVDGKVVRVDAKEFIFQGKIVTRISDQNQGKPCEREGEMLFKITGTRKYWRLQQMQSPCDTTTDYVDIFMR